MAFLEDLLSSGSCKSHGDYGWEESLPGLVLILTSCSSVCGAFGLQVGYVKASSSDALGTTWSLECSLWLSRLTL